jgi:hypothetical protein
MSYRGETIRTGISFGSALAMVIKSGWPHTLHPETCREPLGLELGAERPPGRPTRRIIQSPPWCDAYFYLRLDYALFQA